MDQMIDEILLNIFSYLNAETLSNCSCVNVHWNHVTKSQILWKQNVLKKWPSQKWLYLQVPLSEINWYKTYQDLLLHSWYSPDEMKYFVLCHTIENELISKSLRNIMLSKMENIKTKWVKASLLDHDGNVSKNFDQNMELFYNSLSLDWVFLDKRRGYMDDLFSKMHKRKQTNRNHLCFIRPYQVIPSCLLLYRWLSMFRSIAAPESGLTFYRIWRFRLKHVQTGLIFELCDWKAAMSCTFTNGRPNTTSFREDALELLHVLTHPHFIMRRNGLDPSIVQTFLYVIHASAGGSVPPCALEKSIPLKRKRTMSALRSTSTKGSKQNQCQDLDERLERWRVRRRVSSKIEQPCNPITAVSLLTPRASTTFNDSNSLGDQNSSNSTSKVKLVAAQYSKENTGSDVDSELDSYDNCYVTNCEYYISDSCCIASVEEQHSLQAEVADNWIVFEKECLEKIPVIYDIDDNSWCIQIEHNFSFDDTHQHSMSCDDFESEGTSHSKIMKLDGHGQTLETGLEELNLHLPKFASESGALPTAIALPVAYNNVQPGIIEAIPSSLALYRLICLFELNCQMYICNEQDSIWELSMLHKSTGGVIYFKDYNGVFQVYVSMKEIKKVLEERDEGDIFNDASLYDEFRSSVEQLLNLLMNKSFCHPYGTVAGAVA